MKTNDIQKLKGHYCAPFSEVYRVAPERVLLGSGETDSLGSVSETDYGELD